MGNKRDIISRKLKEQLFEHIDMLKGVPLEPVEFEYKGVLMQNDPTLYAKLTLTIYEKKED